MEDTYLMRIGEAAKYLGVHIETLRRWDRSGKLRARRLPGGGRRYSKSELEALIKPKKETDFDIPYMSPSPSEGA